MNTIPPSYTLFDGKICRVCRHWFLFADFPRYKKSRDGLDTRCRYCVLVEKRQRRENNLERYQEADRVYRERTKDQKSLKNRERRLKYPEKIRESSRRSKKKNSEQVVHYSKSYYASHKAEYRERDMAWRQANPEKVAIISHRRRAKVRSCEGGYTLAQWTELCAKRDNKCLACGGIAPLTADHVVPLSKGGSNYIENIQPLCKSCNSKKWTKTIDYRN